MLSSPNKMSGESILDFDISLKFLGKALAIEGKSAQAGHNLTFTGKLYIFVRH